MFFFPSEIVWPNLKTYQFCSGSVAGASAGASADAGFDFTPNTEKQKDDEFRFVHGVNDSKGKGFAFFASSSVEGTPLKRQQKKKFRRKMGCNSFVISPRVNGNFVSSVQFSPHNTANMSSHSDVQFKELDVASSDTIPAACDTWRLRFPTIKEISSFIYTLIVF